MDDPPIQRTVADAENCLPYLIEAFDQKPILVRHPLRDKYCPVTGDLDIIVFGDDPELLPQRLPVPAGYPLVDVIHLPKILLNDLDQLAIQGVIPHRLLTSQVVSDPDNTIQAKLDELSRLMFKPDHQQQRISAVLDLGYHAIREVGVTRDLPQLALFWCHMAFASLLTALADAHKMYCPNIYTRPFDYVDQLERLSGIEITQGAISHLHLSDDLVQVEQTLWTMHDFVTSAFPEPQWPDNMRQCTRYEYRYFSSKQELAWRIAAAGELDLHLNNAAAVFYLRFMAYMLACLPMVHHRALEGIDVSFIRPQRAVGPDLRKNAQPILPLLKRALGAGQEIQSHHLESTLQWMQSLKKSIETEIVQCGVPLKRILKWTPFEPKAAS